MLSVQYSKLDLVYYGYLIFRMNYIGVLDCNNFFVSCERLFRPDLRHSPVLVLSSNDGCVVARSQEVKDIGVTMGVPYFQIKDIIKNKAIVCFSSHFTLYRDISARVFRVVRELLPDMEQYSIDEAFFSFTAETKTEAEALLRSVKQQVEKRVGIPVSIGLAATKTQAKYANRLAKKAGGVTVLTSEDWLALAGEIQLESIWGVGGRMAARYRAASLLTVSDVTRCPAPRLQTLFGVVGSRLQAELQGVVMYPVSAAHTVQKSTISSRSFKASSTDILVLKDAVAYHVRHAAADIRRLGVLACYLTVTLLPGRHSDYFMRGGTRALDLSEPTADSAVLLTAAMRLVEQLYEAGVPYKKAGISLSKFIPEAYVQTSLFAPAVKKDTRLGDTIDALNARYGRESVQLGRHTHAEGWQSKQEKKSPAYTTDWSAVPVVTA